MQVELSVRVATLLLRLHQQQVVGSGLARSTLVKLHAVLHRQVKVRSVVDTGTTCPAMRFLVSGPYAAAPDTDNTPLTLRKSAVHRFRTSALALSAVR